MNIQKLELKGFVGIKKGMDIDEINLDFSNIDGLIALSGPTGIGKSTIMENLQPFPQLVSRPEKAVKNHVWLRDSTKKLSFIHNEKLYETLVKIDSESGRSEGFIWLDGHPEVKGKISEYTRYITGLIGSSNLFFNSVFCAQNSTKISGLRPAELKALFAEFLGDRLEQLVQYEKGSKVHADTETNRLILINADIERYQQAASGLDEAVGLVSLKKQESGILSTEAATTKKEIDTQSGKLESEKSIQNENNALLAMIRNEESAIEAIEVDISGIEDMAETELQTIRDKVFETKAEIGDVETLLSYEAKIKGAVTRQAELEKDLSEQEAFCKEELAGYQTEQKKLGDKEKEHYIAENKGFGEINDIKQSKLEITASIINETANAETLRTSMGNLENDPELRRVEMLINVAIGREQDLKKRGTDLTCPNCDVGYSDLFAKGHSFTCNSNNCAFIQGALAAKDELPRLHEEATALRYRIGTKRIELDEDLNQTTGKIINLQTKLDETVLTHDLIVSRHKEASDKRLGEIKEISMSVDEKLEAASLAESLINNIKAEIGKTAALSSKLFEIESAKTKQTDLEKRREDLIQEGMEAKLRWNKQVAEKQAKINELKKTADNLRSKIDDTVETRIAEKEFLLSDLKARVEAMNNRSFNLRIAVENAEAKVKEKEAALQKLAETQKEQKRIQTELSEWIYLKNGCGADGLRALEIDNVAPEIAYEANRLLEKALGSWAMVDFNTLNDDGKEVLEPRVIDQDGESVLIANRSGGQQVWALKALRLAMTMISKEKSKRDFQTAYADEDDAGLDVETAQSFTKLYRAFMGIGNFSKCFYITHKPSCVALADHVAYLSKGGVGVE